MTDVGQKLSCLLVIIFMVLLVSESLYATQACSGHYIGAVAKKSKLQYFESLYKEESPFQFEDGSVGFLRELTTITQTEIPLFIQATEVVPGHSGYQNQASKISARNSRQRYLQELTKTTGFVIDTYRERRGWSKEFLEHLQLDALKLAEHVDYYRVYNLTSIMEPDKLIGVLKLVKVTKKSKLQSLPMEQELNVNLESNNGYKFEPSNFVIDKNYNKEIFQELLIRLILKSRELKGRVNPDKPLFYTYGDKVSLRMYKTLGFEIVKGFEHPIEKEGRPWWVIGISSRQLESLFTRIADERSQWSKEETEFIQGKLVAIEKQQARNEIVMWSFFNIDTTSYLGKNFNLPDRFSLVLHKNTEQLKISLTTDSLMDSGVDISFSLPLNTFPLKESSDLNFISKNYSYIYNNGILKLFWNNGLQFEKLEIVVDADFKSPKSIIYEAGRSSDNIPRKKLKMVY